MQLAPAFNILQTTTECSEVNCAFRCVDSATCTACMFKATTGNCTLVADVNIRFNFSLDTTIRVKNGGFPLDEF